MSSTVLWKREWTADNALLMCPLRAQEYLHEFHSASTLTEQAVIKGVHIVGFSFPHRMRWYASCSATRSASISSTIGLRFKLYCRQYAHAEVWAESETKATIPR